LYSKQPDLGTRLKGATVAFAIQGSRHFRDPLPSLEVMYFEGCSIVVFDHRFGERGKRLMKGLRSRATSTRMVAQTQVLVFHDKLLQAEWDIYLALPRPNVLLVADNLPYLQEVLDRMMERKGPRALPDELPEWR